MPKPSMQIVIPMSGFGERFRRAGYRVPKPLIPIDGKPIIAHVIDMFPGETDFIFICSAEHLALPDLQMEQQIRLYCPSARIVGIEPHKLGPVHAVRLVSDLIDPARPVLVNYCDFTCYWNWADFCQFVEQSACAGAIPAYRGFHPHTLGSTNYAYLRETDGWVSEIQEKQPYTDNRMEEFASSGSYYFASGALMLEAFSATVEQNLHVGEEFYVSLAYRYLLKNNLPVAVYPLQHFMQWGTPEDVAEYQRWSAAFRRLALPPGPAMAPVGSVVVPMAGLGQRFINEGYQQTKPLIPVSARPMVLQAVNDLPLALHTAFVLRSDMPGLADICLRLREAIPQAVIATVPAVTQGQACSALIGLDALGELAEGPVSFGACDFGALYDAQKFQSLLEDDDTDVIVWAVRGHTNALRHPKMYGWIDCDGTQIRHISVKTPLADPQNDPVVLGTFTFKRGADFRAAVARMMARDGRINGEFYIDTCINDAIALGLRCRVFEVDSYLSWGTPDDLRCFEYWQSCLHKWPSHPYRLQDDGRIDPAGLAALEERYRATLPERLATYPGRGKA